MTQQEFNRQIYQAMIDHCHQLVDGGHITFNQEGTFTTAEMARNYLLGTKTKSPIWFFAGKQHEAELKQNEIHEITIEGFHCAYLNAQAFDIAYQFQRLASIQQKDYEHFSKEPADKPKFSPKNSETKRNEPKQDETPVIKQSLTTDAMWLHYAGLFFIFFNFTNGMIIGHIDINGDHVPIYDTMPEGWGIITGAANAPDGYRWINNRQPLFGKDYRHALVAA